MSGCDEVREILVAVARAETVSAPGQRFLREHVEACPDCRRRLANERMLTAGLASMASELGGAPSAAVRTALLAEFRRQQVVVPIRRSRRQMMKWVGIAAVAAALLLAVFMTWGRRPETVVAPVKIPVAVVPITPPVIGPAIAVKTGTPTTRVRRRSAALPKRRPTSAPQVQDAPEVATDFIEIPYAEPLRPEQRADVFRIQMPRANMAAFGLPVTGGRLDSRITADVLMGEDGVVRAVRFIR